MPVVICLALRDAAEVLKKIAHEGPHFRAYDKKPLGELQSSCFLPTDLAILPRLNPFEYSISCRSRTCIFVPMPHSLANHCDTKKLCHHPSQCHKRCPDIMIRKVSQNDAAPANDTFSCVFSHFRESPTPFPDAFSTSFSHHQNACPM